MLKELKGKYQKVKRSSSHMWANDSFSFHRLFIFLTSYKGLKRIWNFAWKVIRYYFRKLFGIKPDLSPFYDLWMRKWFPDAAELKKYKKEISQYDYQPKISILVNTKNAAAEYLKQTIDSVFNQIYENWELCILAENNADASIRELVDSCVKRDNRVKLIDRTNSEQNTTGRHPAFDQLTGEFLFLPGTNDLLSPIALFNHLKTLNANKSADMIYSDEDKIDESGKHFDPYFKPDWCPDSLLSRNYIGHTSIIRKSVIEKAACTAIIFDINRNYDLLLRITEHIQNIQHIPFIVYHSRVRSTPESNLRDTVSDCKALTDALTRRNIKGSVSVTDPAEGLYSIRYQITTPGKVSVIIPSKNKADLCQVAVASVFQVTDYPDFEVILIDNNSDEPEFFEFVKSWEQREPKRFRYLKDSGAFNFSRLMNNGAAFAEGSYLLLLNNDTEVTHADWMTAMVEQCQFATTGAVGVKLIYKNDTIQHAGVIVGLGGLAGHSFVGYDKDAAGYHNFLKCITNYSAVTAACLMVRKDAYNEIGGFDEQLAVEYNDIDFCLKLKERGYRNIYLPHVILYHYESISRGHPHKTRKSHRQHLSDVKTFQTRWQKYVDHDPCYNPHLTRIFTDFRLRIQD